MFKSGIDFNRTNEVTRKNIWNKIARDFTSAQFKQFPFPV